MWPSKRESGMFKIFAPQPLIDLAPRWGKKVAKTYPLVFGFSPFAHLFVCAPTEDLFAVIVTERPELIELNMSSRDDFISQFIGNAKVRTEFFREPDYLQLSEKLGALTEAECLYPVPYPAMGGSGKLESYQRGNIWVHLDIFGQTLGFT